MYNNVEDYRVKVAERAAKEQLNLAESWREITADIAKNHYCCTCQVGNVPCPCAKGLNRAKAGGECDCGLFVGQ